MRTTQTAPSGRACLSLLTAATCLVALSTFSGCGSPATAPTPAAQTEAPTDYQPAQPTEEDLAAREREASIERREAEVAARERAAAANAPSRPVPSATPRSETPSHTQATAPGNVASQALAADGPSPAAQRQTVEIPAGTQLQVELQEGLSSATSVAGQEVTARLTADVVVDGVVALPAGSTVGGSVTQAVPRKKIGGTAQISLSFDRVTLPSGDTVAISAPFTEKGKSETGKDAATIGGGAVAGAILGHQIGEKRGKVVGAILGGAAGTAIAAKTGHDIELPVGTVLAVPLDQSASVNASR